MPDYSLTQKNTLASLISDYQSEYTPYSDNTILSEKQITAFQNTIYTYYKKFKRDFPWRNTDNTYFIVVSEIMLQQTQTDRVIEKYNQFIKRFPAIQDLAEAPLADVLEAWQGLGYNRRGKFLYQLAQKVVSDFYGKIPDDIDALVSLPGIGPATAASISAFAFNKPVVFIETNIRSVYIHFFFDDDAIVSDEELRPLVEQTLDRDRPYEWYSALMDVGSCMKKIFPNPGRKSIHYTRQSKFEGSKRQVRGAVLRVLLERGKLNLPEIIEFISKDERIVAQVLDNLLKEGLVHENDGFYFV